MWDNKYRPGKVLSNISKASVTLSHYKSIFIKFYLTMSVDSKKDLLLPIKCLHLTKQKCKQFLDQIEEFGVLLKDLSKVYGNLSFSHL